MSDWEIRGKPALVIIHMQHGIVGKEGVPGQYEEIKKSGAIPHQQALLKAFRDRKLPVIYVNALHVTNALNPAGTLPAYGNLFKMIESSEAKPTDLEVIPELAPQPGEPVLTNWLMGAFTNSGLDQVLKACGAETLVLVGCATQAAVYTTALQAIERWYSVILPGDACASMRAQTGAHDVVLETMAPNIALVTGTEDVVAHL
jgi:nicotinamidase-related amidase